MTAFKTLIHNILRGIPWQMPEKGRALANRARPLKRYGCFRSGRSTSL